MDSSGSPPLHRAATPPSSSRAAYRALLDGDRRPPPLARSVSEQPRTSRATVAVGAVSRASLPGAPSELRAEVPSDTDAALATSLRHTFTTGQLPVLVRQLSQLLGVTSAAETTFRCHICYDDAPLTDAVALTTCGHRFCAACFKAYLELKIDEGQVYPVCFHPVAGADDSDSHRACGVPVETSQIEALVDADSHAKLTRFRFDKEHKHVRECPYCANSQVCSGPQSPQCTCEQCERTFCFLHANAHPDATCADYELRHAESEAVNRAKIQEIAKPCPGCARDVEKNGGCNHMKCIVCNTHFCWLCGEIVEDAMTPAHYDPANGGSCSGRQFEGMEAQPTEWWMRLYVTIAIVVCAPPAFVLTVLAMPFVLCWKRDRSVSDRFESVAAAFTIALQVPLAIAYFTIVGIIQNVVIAVLFVFRVLRNAMCRPRTTREAHAAPPNDLEAGVATPGTQAAPR